MQNVEVLTVKHGGNYKRQKSLFCYLKTRKQVEYMNVKTGFK